MVAEGHPRRGEGNLDEGGVSRPWGVAAWLAWVDQQVGLRRRRQHAGGCLLEA